MSLRTWRAVSARELFRAARMVLAARAPKLGRWAAALAVTVAVMCLVASAPGALLLVGLFVAGRRLLRR